MTKNNQKSINEKKKIILVILDGFGYGREDNTNAIYLANPKTFKMLNQKYPSIKINASEEFVGLPKNQPGNSEVGHLTIGAGRIFHTGLGLINNAIKTNEFMENDELIRAIKLAKEKHTNVHLLGLASNGDVHASLGHLYKAIELCNKYDVIPIIDLFCDGRDTKEKQFLEDFINIKKDLLDKNKAKLGIIAGRYYAMDRNSNWDRTEQTLDCLLSIGDNTDPIKYIENCYSNNETDEFIKPKSFNTEQTKIKEDDSLIFFNFRSDRIRQLIHLFTKNINDYEYVCKKTFNVHIVGFMDYKMKGMNNIAFIQPENKVYLGEIISKNNLKQLRIAETEKYAHVTYFLDSMHKEEMQGMECKLIPSPSVATYDLKPEMSASEITDYILENYKKYDLIVVNYANSDMVGHTGIMDAAKKAISAIDNELTRLYNEFSTNNEYTMIITADHGNSDEMIDKNGIIVTSHTINKVPLIIVDNTLKLKKEEGSLVNITPTILDLMGIEKPDCMDDSLIEK